MELNKNVCIRKFRIKFSFLGNWQHPDRRSLGEGGWQLATLPHLDRRSLGEGGWQHLECSAQDSHFNSR